MMERKLAEYRVRKEREAKKNQLKLTAKTFFSKVFTRDREKMKNGLALGHTSDHNKETSELLEDVPSVTDEEVISVTSDDDYSYNSNCYYKVIYYLFYFILWLTVYIIFIQWQFGTVFLIVSAIVFMYVNTRTGPRRSNEISAYSVFNRNCVSIDGTLKAEQFEREIRYGSGSVK